MFKIIAVACLRLSYDSQFAFRYLTAVPSSSMNLTEMSSSFPSFLQFAIHDESGSENLIFGRLLCEITKKAPRKHYTIKQSSKHFLQCRIRKEATNVWQRYEYDIFLYKAFFGIFKIFRVSRKFHQNMPKLHERKFARYFVPNFYLARFYLQPCNYFLLSCSWILPRSHSATSSSSNVFTSFRGDIVLLQLIHET